MVLNHLNLTVSNVQEARRFLETYFGLKSMESASEDAVFVALKDENGFTLTLMQTKTGHEVLYPPTFHMGFLKQGSERTHQLYMQLKADGFDVKPPGHYRVGEFYFYTPYGFTIQVS